MGRLPIALLAAMLLIAIPVAAKEYIIGDQKTPVAKGDPAATYVGAEKCKTCHPDKYEDWKKSGHPYKLMTPEEAKMIRPEIPLPEGYTWDDILYVLGGWGWKSRYIGKDGFIITRTKDGQPLEKNQYNWETGTWSAYHSGEDKKYDCTKCHNTGSTYDENHMNLPGIVGNWTFRGVQCEACHGPGSEHIARGGGKGVAIIVNESAEFCGLCHVRGTSDKPPASGGFIRHHEQYQELKNSGGMANLKCVTCHDPHKPVHKGATNDVEGYGIIKQCEDCHADVAEEFEGSEMQEAGVRCIDCHMPKAAKSAVAISKYVGDVRVHLFRINTDPNAEFIFKADDGKEYASGYLTLDYACLQCHEDKDKAWAASYAEKDIHELGKVKETPAPATTAPPTQPPETAPPKKGACGPTSLALLALLPLLGAVVKRRL
jgi:hypothetical protein